MSNSSSAGPGPAARGSRPTRDDVARLGAAIDGTAMTPEDAGYDAACAGFNGAAHRRPDVVVMVEDAQDVVRAIAFADEFDLPVAVMSTGHQATRPMDGGLLVNTSRMNRVQVDAVARRAVLGAGAQWRDVLPLTLTHHLSPIHGSSGLVGVVGFTLGGGVSPVLGRKLGWAADHVVAIEVVTAGGEVLRAGPTEEADLFWALRGGRGNFGIVTAIEIDLFPIEAYVGGGLYFDGSNAAPVLAAFAALTSRAPVELSTSLTFLRLPPIPAVPEVARGRFVLNVSSVFLGPASDLEMLLAPLRAAAPVLWDSIRITSPEEYERLSNDPTEPTPALEESALLVDLGPGAQEALLEAVGPGAASGPNIVAVRHLEGAFDAVRDAPGPNGALGARFSLWALTIGMPDRLGGETEGQALMRAMAPWSTGKRYLNMAPDDDHPERSFSDDDWRRLRRIKAVVDPGHRFRTQYPLPPA